MGQQPCNCYNWLAIGITDWQFHMTEAYPYNCCIVCWYNRHADKIPHKGIGCHHYLPTSQNDMWETTCAPSQRNSAAYSTERQYNSLLCNKYWYAMSALHALHLARLAILLKSFHDKNKRSSQYFIHYSRLLRLIQGGCTVHCATEIIRDKDKLLRRTQTTRYCCMHLTHAQCWWT